MDQIYSILSHETVSNQWKYTVRMNPHHPIFAGHFPDFPIVPGVVLIQIIREIIELELDKKIRLKKIQQVKFIKMVFPSEAKQMEVSINQVLEGDLKINAEFRMGNTTYCKLIAMYQF